MAESGRKGGESRQSAARQNDKARAATSEQQAKGGTRQGDKEDQS